ncbi:phage tail protein [Glacieibacterium frigidum]|uniref:Phage tail protein n=1 Tax=Glacieibacterium frigidum TaxID=2593303 RepID=A0A552UG14_9SPHN|nr:phage tail protein [Glacieibacterium frigidum]TRW17166.1 phage tail protein [Glacieibacterium frigidum]
MAEFTVNPTRLDPYKSFKFRLKWDGKYIAGVSRISALKRTTEVVTHRQGGAPSASRQTPGQTRFEPITIERGVTHDMEFERWANKIFNLGSGGGAQASLGDFRKDIVIELHNEAGQLVMAYKVFRCWPSQFQALPDLDANANAVAIQTLVLENEGWERDYDVVEPSEPKFNEPA